MAISYAEHKSASESNRMPLEHRIFLPNGAIIGVWQITETEKKLTSTYKPNEKEAETLESFKSEARRKQWLSVRIMLCELLNQRCNIIYKDSGKPMIQELNVDISISHSHDYSSVMHSPTTIGGVDIQKVSDKVGRVKHKFLHQQEKEWLGDNIDSLELLSLIWSAKEAVYKLYSDSTLFFNEHLSVESFELKEMGEIFISRDHGGESNVIQLGYQQFDGYVLVFIIE